MSLQLSGRIPWDRIPRSGPEFERFHTVVGWKNRISNALMALQMAKAGRRSDNFQRYTDHGLEVCRTFLEGSLNGLFEKPIEGEDFEAPFQTALRTFESIKQTGSAGQEEITQTEQSLLFIDSRLPDY